MTFGRPRFLTDDCTKPCRRRISNTCSLACASAWRSASPRFRAEIRSFAALVCRSQAISSVSPLSCPGVAFNPAAAQRAEHNLSRSGLLCPGILPRTACIRANAATAQNRRFVGLPSACSGVYRPGPSGILCAKSRALCANLDRAAWSRPPPIDATTARTCSAVRRFRHRRRIQPAANASSLNTARNSLRVGLRGSRSRPCGRI